MADINAISADKRENTGSNTSKNMRRSGKIPAIIYGDGKDPQPISLDMHQIRREISKSSFTNKLYDINLEKDKVRVLVQDIQQNPITDQLEHVDFLRVTPKTIVTIEVPVSFINDTLSPGIKRGGVLNIVRHTIEVNCPVDAIPEKFEFDLTDLEVGDSIHISHTKIEENVKTTIKDRDFTVATILAPSALLSESSEEEEEKEEDSETEEENTEQAKENEEKEDK